MDLQALNNLYIAMAVEDIYLAFLDFTVVIDSQDGSSYQNLYLYIKITVLSPH